MHVFEEDFLSVFSCGLIEQRSAPELQEVGVAMAFRDYLIERRFIDSHPGFSQGHCDRFPRFVLVKQTDVQHLVAIHEGGAGGAENLNDVWRSREHEQEIAGFSVDILV